MESLEKQRAAALGAVCGRPELLENHLRSLPAGIRTRFIQTRTELKIRLLKIQSRTRGIAGYAKSRGQLGRELMEELIPAAKSRTYTKHGHTSRSAENPMIVSRHL